MPGSCCSSPARPSTSDAVTDALDARAPPFPNADPGGSAAVAGLERKVQQLTKVIYYLNAKGDDAGDVNEQAQSYENENEGILRDAGDRVRRFQAAMAHQTDMKLIEQKVREVEVKHEGQKQRALPVQSGARKPRRQGSCRRWSG